MNHSSFIKTLLLWTVILIPQFIFAQSKITGKVTGSNQEPLAFANVELLRASDTTKIISGGITDFKGRYEFQNIQQGIYVLKVSMLGYCTYSGKFTVSSKDVVKNIILKPLATRLKEVSIQGKSINNEINKTEYYITETDRKKASSCLDLVGKVPELFTDKLNYSISTMDGGSVKILINGLSATVQDLIGLRPDQVIKVVYYDIPPARYAGSGFTSVINIITKKNQRGGNVVADLQNAVKTGFGNYEINFNYNIKNSQFGFYYYLGHRSYSNRIMSDTYSYTINGNKYKDIQTGINSPFGYDQNILNFDFIHLKSNNYTFRLRFSPNYTPVRNTYNYDFIFGKNNATVDGIGHMVESNKEFTPSADIYFSKNLPKKQELIFDAVVNYFNSQENYKRSEISSQNSVVLNDSMANHGIKRSIIFEANYSKKYKNVTAAFGLRYNAANLSQKLLNLFDNSKYDMRTSEKYAYAEVIGHIKKISYQANLGLSLNKFYDNTLSKQYSFFSLRPLIRLNYNLSKDATFSGYYKASPHIPTLSELSLNQYYIDNYIVYSGNPDLLPYNENLFWVKYSLNRKRLFCSIMFAYYYSKNPIQEEYNYSQNNYISLSSDNQGWERQILLSSSLNYNPFKSHWLQLTFYGSINRYLIKMGSGDVNSLNGYEAYVSVDLSYKDITFNFKLRNDYKELEGQSIILNPVYSNTAIQYKHKNLTLTAAILNPLSKSMHGSSTTVNNSIVYEKNVYDIYDNGRMFYFELNYNLNFGKRFKRIAKKINNKDTDIGSFKVKVN